MYIYFIFGVIIHFNFILLCPVSSSFGYWEFFSWLLGPFDMSSSLHFVCSQRFLVFFFQLFLISCHFEILQIFSISSPDLEAIISPRGLVPSVGEFYQKPKSRHWVRVLLLGCHCFQAPSVDRTRKYMCVYQLGYSHGLGLD